MRHFRPPRSGKVSFQSKNHNPVKSQNRPLNSQVVADFLQNFNLKKTVVQKALDNLAEGGKITFKEYGKQKIYLARQDQFEIPNTEELNQMKEENGRLQEMLEEQKKSNSQLEGEIKSLQSNLTLDEIQSKDVQLRKQVCEMTNLIFFILIKFYSYLWWWWWRWWWQRSGGGGRASGGGV
ncbi:hypothetical protein HanHA300_Chr05g0188621 [Helianthus annuus]|nr:hypothetical protein HanHA300_Chr05g0188621 [Helianthus annuus]KAJ0748210.1 hypothetical protein HanOQP8_Chr05g0198701 [Helianthus annuus]